MKATFSVGLLAKALERPNLTSHLRGRAQKVTLAKRHSRIRVIGTAFTVASSKDAAVPTVRPSNNKIQRTGALIHCIRAIELPAADLERSKDRGSTRSRESKAMS